MFDLIADSPNCCNGRKWLGVSRNAAHPAFSFSPFRWPAAWFDRIDWIKKGENRIAKRSENRKTLDEAKIKQTA
jgi:hypothetical protein